MTCAIRKCLRPRAPWIVWFVSSHLWLGLLPHFQHLSIFEYPISIFLRTRRKHLRRKPAGSFEIYGPRMLHHRDPPRIRSLPFFPNPWLFSLSSAWLHLRKPLRFNYPIGFHSILLRAISKHSKAISRNMTLNSSIRWYKLSSAAYYNDESFLSSCRWHWITNWKAGVNMSRYSLVHIRGDPILQRPATWGLEEYQRQHLPYSQHSLCSSE